MDQQIEFRTIDTYPGYKFSSDGKVYSAWFAKGISRKDKTPSKDNWKELIGGLDYDGYRKVILCKDGKRYHRRVHTLILEAFYGPRPEGMVGCHKNNNNILDNCIENLKYDTQKNNMADKIKHGTHQIGDRNPTRMCRNWTREYLYNIKKDIDEDILSKKEISIKYNISISSIKRIKRGTLNIEYYPIEIPHE